MATTPRISALIEALQQEMEAHGDLPVLGYATAIEYTEIDLERNDDGEEPVMLLILDGPARFLEHPEEGTSLRRFSGEAMMPASGEAKP